MASLLLSGLYRLLHTLTNSHTPHPPPPTSPQPNSPEQKSAESYEELLAAAICPKHPLHIRQQLPNRLVHDLLTAQTQLVNLSTGEILKSSHESVYTIDDITRPPSLANSVIAALNGCEWDSGLVQTGFDWTASSVWFIPLDTSLLSFELLDRHFRMVATLSSPDSRTIVLYPLREVVVDGFKLEPPFEDMEAFMKLSGFEVESVSTLAELSDGRVPQYEQYMNAMNVAVVRPAPRAPPSTMDNFSEVTYMSNDISSQTASTEFEEYLSSDRRLVRFELDISGLPSHLAVTDNQIAVIGSESCVGCWDPRHSKRMTGRIDVPGVLVADVSVSVFASDMEYKYAVVRSDHVVEWETGWNRCLTGDVKIARDEWRCS